MRLRSPGLRRGLRRAGLDGAAGRRAGRGGAHDPAGRSWPPARARAASRRACGPRRWRRATRSPTRCWTQAVVALGAAIGSVLNLLDLQRVVIGGGMTEKLGTPLVDRIAAATEPYRMTTGHARHLRPRRARRRRRGPRRGRPGPRRDDGSCPSRDQTIPPRERLIFALDVPDPRRRRARAGGRAGRQRHRSTSSASSSCWPATTSRWRGSCSARGKKLFLDLKLFDVPETVARARFARRAASARRTSRCTATTRSCAPPSASAASPASILAVTVLTSLDRGRPRGPRVRRRPAGSWCCRGRAGLWSWAATG